MNLTRGYANRHIGCEAAKAPPNALFAAN